MNRDLLSQQLNEIADFLDLLGENPFKVRAHQAAARIIDTFSGDLEKAIVTSAIGEVKGIGPALLEKLKEFQSTGAIKEHALLKKKIPEGVVAMLQIPGLGPKKVRALHEKLQLKSIGELEYACKENRLIKLDGFGEKTQAKILKNIEFLKKNQDRFLFSEALLEADLISSTLKKAKGVSEVAVAGSIRRRKEIIKDIDILVASKNPKTATQVFVKHPSVEAVMASGETKSQVKLKNGMICDLRVVSAEEFPFALLYFTGSKEHNTELRTIAKAKGLKLNEYGLFKGEKLIKCRDEKEIYEQLGLSFIPPELRENSGEFDFTLGKEPPALIEVSQIRGVFHCHTTDSDGSGSLEEMVRAAEALGYEYIGISDHSGSAGYAHGLKKDRVLEQFKRIEALQKKVKIRILKGVESDILSDGKLDYDEALLKKFDFVIGSIHSGFSQSEMDMTKRVVKALRNPYMDMLGHPTGRLLLSREAYAINMSEVIEEAAKQGVIIEVNAHPQRLDLDWRLCRQLKHLGGYVSINPDAHSVAGLEDIEYGVGIARKGWLEPNQVVNSWGVKKILETLRRNR
ncbi:MAG: DNA polymerase/3'-5' exonuclease PolX [Oligoflexia bacterium]|nr:DNA polymerase/3'-5' exonuclease PolX [Oligoflexia bacterium]